MPVEAIGQATAFVEANLTEEITVADMANAAGYSLYHFCRTFSSITYHTPYDYLMRRRLSEAACRLFNSGAKILTTALEYQFKNQETFSRAFKRMFGLLPSQARLQGSIDPRRYLPYLSAAHLRCFRARETLRVERVQKGPLELAGIMAPIGSGTDGKQALWNALKHLLPAENGFEYYGITFYPPGWEIQSRLYFAGVAEKTSTQAHPFLVHKTLPAQACVCFSAGSSLYPSPFDMDLLYTLWQTRMGMQHLPAYEIESYPCCFPLAEEKSAGCQIWLPDMSGSTAQPTSLRIFSPDPEEKKS